MYYLCSSLLSIATIKTMTTATSGEKDLFGLHFITEWIRAGTQIGSELGGKNESRDCGGILLIDLFNLHFYVIQDYLPRCDTAHNGLGPPLSIINQDNTPTDLSQTGQSGGGIFSTEILSSLMNLPWVKLTKRTLTRQIMYIIIITLSIHYIFFVISLF